MAKVIWGDPALDDVRSVIEFVARDSPVYAERLATAILNAPKRLERFPQSGSVVPEFQMESIRELICNSHRIIYQIRGDVCYVVAVVHSSRDFLQAVDQERFDLQQ